MKQRGNQKLDIEREKIQAQRDIANNQLEIARTNKNKFDDKPDKNKKKQVSHIVQKKIIFFLNLSSLICILNYKQKPTK